MEFSRQDYWNGLLFPPAEDLPNPQVKPASPTLAGGSFTTEPPGKPPLATLRDIFGCCTGQRACVGFGVGDASAFAGQRAEILLILI